jgi:HEAT repeat protein
MLSRVSTTVRPTVARALASAGDRWADQILDELSRDEQADVRTAVAWAAARLVQPPAGRLIIGVRACRPANLHSLLGVLESCRRRQGDRDAPIRLGPEADAVVLGVARAAASQERVVGIDFERLTRLASHLPRLGIEACWARIRWLASNPARPLHGVIGRDGLPDELAPSARVGARPSDREALLDLVEDPETHSEANGTARALLSWIDDGPPVTKRLIDWLASGDGRLQYEARALLKDTRDPEAFKHRASELLDATLPIDVTQALLDARSPRWWVGSGRTVHEQIAKEFAGWAKVGDSRLAAVGRAGVKRFSQHATELAQEEPDDHEVCPTQSHRSRS